MKHSNLENGPQGEKKDYSSLPLVDFDTLKPLIGNISFKTARERWQVPCVPVTKRCILFRIQEVLDYLASGSAQRSASEFVAKRKARAAVLAKME